MVTSYAAPSPPRPTLKTRLERKREAGGGGGVGDALPYLYDRFAVAVHEEVSLPVDLRSDLEQIEEQTQPSAVTRLSVLQEAFGQEGGGG